MFVSFLLSHSLALSLTRTSSSRNVHEIYFQCFYGGSHDWTSRKNVEMWYKCVRALCAKRTGRAHRARRGIMQRGLWALSENEWRNENNAHMSMSWLWVSCGVLYAILFRWVWLDRNMRALDSLTQAHSWYVCGLSNRVTLHNSREPGSVNLSCYRWACASAESSNVHYRLRRPEEINTSAAE